MKDAFIVLPNQLFIKLPSRDFSELILIEHSRFFSDFRFHKKKLIFHRASMKYYQDLLEREKFKVKYLEYEKLLEYPSLAILLKQKRIKHVSLYDPVDNELKDELIESFNNASIAYEFIESPLFICSESSLRNYFDRKDHFSMNSFYVFQRKKMGILLENGKPVGGKWSFDKDNRHKLPRDLDIPEIRHPKSSKFVKEAGVYVEKNFHQNPGLTDGFFYPVTHNQARNWLNDFIKNRLDSFGPYEDSISQNQDFLFHSLLSPLLNSGLLTADEVLKEVLDLSNNHNVRLNSLEGFIRQLIGWREFIRAAYVFKGCKQMDSNFWGFKNKIPRQFYEAQTGIAPLDNVVNKVKRNAYAHHIERLMVLGNFMLLCEIHPKEVYRWFMELFIDAYPWVMIPNVFGMSQYADGGLITTKPYISSSNYIRKMSNFKSGDWCNIWDSLFWRFIYKYKNVFAGNPRMKIMAVQAERMGHKKISTHIKKAEEYLRTLLK